MYKVTDRFTTLDGSWEPTGEPYSITLEMARKYGDSFPEKGAATHILARIVGGPSRHVRFFTRDGLHHPVVEVKESGWANHNIERGSGYNPDRGESGWWNVEVAHAPSEIAEGFGLPHGLHVSNFVVFEWQEFDVEADDGPEIPDELLGEGPLAVEVKFSRDGESITYSGVVTRKTQ